jgi:hypothetical protein
MAGMNDRNYSFDINLQLSDGAAPIAASGYAQVGGAQQILDLGGNQASSPKWQDRVDMMCVIDITALGVAAGNLARFSLVGSNDPALGSGNVELASTQVGNGLGIPNPGVSAAPGRIEMPFTNNQLGQIYEYVALYVTIAGGGTVTARAFIAVIPRS